MNHRKNHRSAPPSPARDHIQRVLPDLKKLFLQERARFAAKYPIVANCGLVVTERKCLEYPCAPRDLAWADIDANYIYLTERALTLAPENIIGLLRHELAHMADPHVNRPGCEQRADDIAEEVTGEKIRYDAREIQTIGRGTYPRPKHLHQ